jgi:hypothetical protein
VKLRYFDEEGDLCEQEFKTEQELNSFANTLNPKDIIGVIEDNPFQGLGSTIRSCIQNEADLREEMWLLNLHFPKNKVN